MKESDLYNPVKAWLKEQGCTKVCPEVLFHYRPVDVVGIGDDLVIGVELKLSLTKGVIYQAHTLSMGCDRAYVAVATKPRDPSRAAKHDLGVLRVVDGRVEVILEARPSQLYGNYKAELLEKCARMSDEGLGGVPCLDGVGPAQHCKGQVDEYRKEHPDATWRELYEKIPNHYASHNSMRQSLTTGLDLRAYWKKLRKQGKV